MKTVTCTDFRKQTSNYLSKVEHGESIVLLRRGKPVAEVIPFSEKERRAPAWKKPGLRLKLRGSDLSSVILAEREESH